MKRRWCLQEVTQEGPFIISERVRNNKMNRVEEPHINHFNETGIVLFKMQILDFIAVKLYSLGSQTHVKSG